MNLNTIAESTRQRTKKSSFDTVVGEARFRFPVKFVTDDFNPQNSRGVRVRELAEAIENEGFEVECLMKGPSTNLSQQHSDAASFILCVEEEESYLCTFVKNTRRRNLHVPIYILGESSLSLSYSSDLLREVHGFIHMFEEPFEIVAKDITRNAQRYLGNLQPPFFKALIDYAEDGSYSWHCPGHSGGVAFLKSPVGRIFHQFFGENMLRADVCNAVEELGQLLDHNGSIGNSERNAARIFKADHCFFVTNGVSTSNRMVYHHTVAENDIVLLDRNCSSSVLHGIILTKAIPIFLKRNTWNGIIGPIPESEFDMQNIQDKIQSNPLTKNLQDLNPRMLTITQSTLNGLLYNTRVLKNRFDGSIDNLHFVEARMPHAAFHPFYKAFHAMETEARCKHSIIFVTQSIQKLIGISQASHVLVRDSTSNKLDMELFNESYLMHASTSPQYSIIASCDIAASMMEPPEGTALVEESIAEALDFRRAMHQIYQRYGEKDWWFKVLGPNDFQKEGIGQAEEWILPPSSQPGSCWHGFKSIAPGFNMLDPLKVTIFTSGLSYDSVIVDIPAAVVTKYLAENGVIIEMTGYYSFCVLFSIGITKGRWSSLISTLQHFKDDFDNNRYLWRMMPSLSSQYKQFETQKLRDLSLQINKLYKNYNIDQLFIDIYENDIIPVIRPSDAFEKIARRLSEKVLIDDLEGRTAVSTITPYPPGVPLIILGEVFNKKIVEYLKFARDFYNKFPGLHSDIHGVSKEVHPDGNVIMYADCAID